MHINGYAVDPLKLPGIILISFTVVLSSPFRWFESYRYRKAIRDQKVKAPVFIVGHPRSGTTFLHYLMCKDERFAYCTTLQALIPHLFLSAGALFRGILKGSLPDKRPMDNLKMGLDLPKEEEFAMAAIGAESLVAGYYFPGNFMRNFKRNVVFDNKSSGPEKEWLGNYSLFIQKLSFVNKNKQLLLKSPGNTGRISQLLKLYPDAKFIHISRNPYEVYRSNLHLYEKLLPLLSLQRVRSEDVRDFVLKSYSLLMKKYFQDRSLISPENILEISYEELVKDPMAVLERTYRHLGLEGFNDVRAVFEKELQGYKQYERNELSISEADKTSVKKEWAFAFEKLSYPVDL